MSERPTPVLDREETPVAPPGDDQWTLVIRPRRNLLDLRLGELWRYRDLIALFVWRDFVAVYKQTLLGPTWHLFNPIITAVTFTVIFGRLAKLPTDGLPQFLFYMSGSVVWTYFSTCLMSTSNTFVANAGLFGKVYFPRLAIPVAVLFSNLIRFSIQFMLFLGFALYFSQRGAEVHPNAWVLLTPVLLLLMAGLGLGFGIIISSMTTRYRDLQQLVGTGLQMWMYATPVIYPVSMVPEQYQRFVMLNPVAPVIEAFRYAFLGAGTIHAAQLLYTFAVMAVVLFVGLVLFNRVERTFMDTV